MSAWALHCPSCPTVYPIGAGLFGCPGGAAGGEHSLRRMLSHGYPTAEEVRRAWGRSGRTFERLHPLLSACRLAGEAGYARILERVSGNLLRHEGRAFDVTPLAATPALAAAIGRSGSLWVKDETGNVTGSHKGRHLMGTLLYLEALKTIDPTRGRSALAIYSCGNAALAAAAVARAGGCELHAFVPADVDPHRGRAARRARRRRREDPPRRDRGGRPLLPRLSGGRRRKGLAPLRLRRQRQLVQHRGRLHAGLGSSCCRWLSAPRPSSTS